MGLANCLNRWIFVDSRVHRIVNLDFRKQSFFKRGKFPLVFRNGTDDAILQNPWRDHNNAAPFDQSFYLILDLAVGGTSGWFPDGYGGKMWFDGSNSTLFADSYFWSTPSLTSITHFSCDDRFRQRAEYLVCYVAVER